ncbi:hypothetical protein ACUHGC_10380 [Testudinibacter sp. P27/CKL/0425]
MNNIRWQVAAHFDNQKPFIIGSDSDIQAVLNLIKSTLEKAQNQPLTGLSVKRVTTA